MKIFVQSVKKAKNKPPVLVLKEHPFKENAEGEVNKLMEAKTSYFEVHDKDQKTRTVFERPENVKNYIKKVHKIK